MGSFGHIKADQLNNSPLTKRPKIKGRGEDNGFSLPLVSIVVATKNRPTRLLLLLNRIREQDYANLETIVVDDGSTPATPPLPIDLQIRHEVSMGACTARNAGFAAAKGKYVVIFDDDALPTQSDLISRAVERAESTNSLGVIGFRQLTPDGNVHYMQPSRGDELCYAGHFFGYGALFSREALLVTSGFAELLGFCHEEVELSLRLLDAGYVVLYDPSLEVTHHEEPVGRDWKRILRMYLRNVWFTVILRYPLAFIIPGLLLQLLRHLNRTRARGFGLDLSGVIWATFELLTSLPALFRIRQPVTLRTLRLSRQLGRAPIAVEP